MGDIRAGHALQFFPGIAGEFHKGVIDLRKSLIIQIGDPHSRMIEKDPGLHFAFPKGLFHVLEGGDIQNRGQPLVRSRDHGDRRVAIQEAAGPVHHF